MNDNKERIKLAKQTFTERQKKFVKMSNKITKIMKDDLDWQFCHMRKYYKRSLVKDEDEMPSGCIVVTDEYYILSEYPMRGKKVNKIISIDRASYNRTRGCNTAVIRRGTSHSIIPYGSFGEFCGIYKSITARQVDSHVRLYAYEAELYIDGRHYPRGLNDAYETMKEAIKQIK